MELSNPPCHVDLFAGCGGISLGLYNAGWRGLFAIEKSDMAFETLRHNLIDKKKHFDWPVWLPITEHDIVDVLRDYKKDLEELEGKVDLVAGGPPCQGFSFAGKRNENDERNKLVHSYVKFVSLVKPRVLLFENVKGFTAAFISRNGSGKVYSEYVKKELMKLGYAVEGRIIDFSKFGIPQKRKRFILVGMRDACPERFFREICEARKKFLKSKGLRERVTIRQAISDLERKHGETRSKESPLFAEGVCGKAKTNYQKLMRSQETKSLPDSHRFARHRKATVERFRFILENCPKNVSLSQDYKDKLCLKKRSITPLSGDREALCPVLTTLPDDYIHYSEPRILTVREYARIQSFPDWYEFKSKYTTGGSRRKIQVPRYTQIGNAFPPLFAELTGTVLLEQLRRNAHNNMASNDVDIVEPLPAVTRAS